MADQGAEWLGRVCAIAREDAATHDFMARRGPPSQRNQDYYAMGFARAVQMLTRFVQQEDADVSTFLGAYIASGPGDYDRWIRILEGDEP